MSNRMLVGLGTALLLAGPALAEGPESAAAAPDAVVAGAEVPADGPARPWAFWGARGDGPADTPGQFWATGEYLFAWFSGDHLPPLVTTSPAGTPAATTGVLGTSTTKTLFGGDFVNDDLRPGFRVAFGYWFNPEHTFGLEAGFTMIGTQSTGFNATSTGTPILARPFFDVSTGTNSSVLVAYPGTSAGAIQARARSDDFYGVNIDLTESLVDTSWFHLQSLFGYRFFRYDEGIRIQQTITSNPNFAAGTVFTGQDDFATHNEFHGADFGFRAVLQADTLSLALVPKLGVGHLSRYVDINGSETTSVPGVAPVTSTGNLLALTSNISHFHNDEWTVVPELGATLAWAVSDNLRLTVGYSVLWLNDVALAADQINENINSTMLPHSTVAASGPTAPTFTFVRGNAWFQTLSVGLEFTY